MKIVSVSEELGLIWYTHKNYKQKDTHVVCFGLQVKQFDDEEKAKEEYKSCIDWVFANQ